MLEDTLRALGANLADALRQQRDAVADLRAEVAAQGRELARLAVQPSRDAAGETLADLVERTVRDMVERYVEESLQAVEFGRAAQRLDDLDADFGNMSRRLDDVEVDNNDIRGLVADLADRVDDLRDGASVQQAVDDLTEQVEALTDRLDRAADALQG